MKSRKANIILGKIFTYAVLIIALVYTLIPFCTILLTSFRTPKDAARGPFTWPHEWDIISNYVEAWGVGNFSKYMWNSFYMMVLTVLGTLLIATLAGYAFAKYCFPGKSLVYYLLLLGMMIPFQTIMLPMYFNLKALGLLNSLNGIILLQIGTGEGFAIMMMRSFFVGIPDSLIEAARLDGASEIRVLTRVILPNTFPAWTSLIVISAMGSWNNLLAPMLYIFKDEKYPVPYALYAFQSAHSTNYQLLAAGMMISILPLMVVYVIFQRQFQQGMMLGAVKG